MTSSFELIAKSPANFTIPVEKFLSKRTGIKLYVCNVKGPVVDGYISLATEAADDDGLPHTLEHMVFLGSEDYPYPGVLDILANKIYAAGTNAWTDVDNTTYMLSTVEKNGFLQLLPIYLDHILYPLLNEAGFITEVYHVNGEGEDAGVVYSEMQSHENEDETIVERAMHKHMYPNADCGYRYETGGALKNLRTSTTHARVREFHKKFYKPGNMAIIIAGEIESSDVIEVLEKFEEKILTKNPETWKIAERPFSRPIERLTDSIIETVQFPCDEEKTAHGLTSIGWRGPHINNLEELISLDLIFSYLTESSISALQSHFIHKNSLCNRINYTIEEYKETFIMLSFINTQLKSLNDVKGQLEEIISSIVSGKIDFDINRMRAIIQMKILEIIDKFEDSPHDTISRLCIGDFLYGESAEEEFHKRFSQVEIFEKLKNESSSFWIKLIEKWLHKTHSITVIARPSEELMRSIGEEDKRRVNERKSSLGKKGLRELAIKVENAIAENDDEEVPDDVYDQLYVPSLENLKMKEIKQYNTHSENHKDDFKHIINFDNLDHLQLQIDNLKNTSFVQLSLMIDTNQVDKSLRRYLQLYMKLIFELPIHNDDVNLSHDEVVREINKDLLEFDASIGIDGDEFEFGVYPQYSWIFIKTSLKQFETGVKWLKYLTFDSVFDKYEVKIGVEKLLKEITHRKQQPFDLLQCVSNEIAFKSDSNFCLNGLLRQEKFLKEEILPKLEEAENDEVLRNLNDLKKSLLKDTQLRFYLCADLDKLNETFENNSFDSIICKYFPKSLLNSNKAFNVKQTWEFKRDDQLHNSPNKISSPKSDYIIGLGSSESSFLRLSSPISINSYKHADYAGMLVLKEYFCQTEGPLWEAVRGPGYCYYQSLSVIPETAQLELCLDECSHVVKAYDATRKVIMAHLDDDAFDEQLLETAKNSLIFMLIDSLKSASNMSQYSMTCFFKDINIDSIKTLFGKIQKVEIEDLKILLKTHVMPLFNDTHSHCLIVSNPSKLNNIVDEFSQKFDRKLIHIGKLDECFCCS